MKKLALLLALLLTGLSFCFAQITITYSNMQSALAVGTQYSSFGDTTHTQTFVGTASGTAQTWDFRSRPYYIQGSGVSVAPSSAPNIAEFPTANVVTYSAASTVAGYVYFSLLASGLDQLGYGDISGASHYSPPVPVMRLPCSIGTNWTYRSDTNWISPPPFPVWVVNTNTYRVDAFGTLRLPMGDYQALRLKNTGITYSSFLGNITQSRSVTYNFETTSLVAASVSVDSAQENLANVNPRYITYTRLGSSDVKPATGMMPADFALGQNYPNPFNPTTSFEFKVPSSKLVTLRVYNVLGREVATLANKVMHPGIYTAQWDASGQASGVYFYRLQAGNFVDVKKMLLLK